MIRDVGQDIHVRTVQSRSLSESRLGRVVGGRAQLPRVDRLSRTAAAVDVKRTREIDAGPHAILIVQVETRAPRSLVLKAAHALERGPDELSHAIAMVP